MTEDQSNTQTALRLVDCLGRQDYAQARTMLAPDALWWHTQNRGYSTDAMIAGAEQFAARFGDQSEFRVVGTRTDGDRVTVEAVRTGEADGQPFEDGYLILFVFSGGLIETVKIYHDSRHLAQIAFAS